MKNIFIDLTKKMRFKWKDIFFYWTLAFSIQKKNWEKYNKFVSVLFKYIKCTSTRYFKLSHVILQAECKVKSIRNDFICYIFISTKWIKKNTTQNMNQQSSCIHMIQVLLFPWIFNLNISHFHSLNFTLTRDTWALRAYFHW